MKQILLAIDGDVPSRPVFKYAADLCQQIRAELCILQFTKETQDRQYAFPSPGNLRRQDKRPPRMTAPGRQFGNSDNLLSVVTGPLKQMLENPGCSVPIRVTRSAGSLRKDLSTYIDTHHDIVLTVYDPSQDKARASLKHTNRIDGLKGKLGVPLVVVKTATGGAGGTHH